MAKIKHFSKHILYQESICYKKWSGKRDSNPQPLPWQGNALPIELFPHTLKS